MKQFFIFSVTVMILLALAGTVNASETTTDKTGVTTNVWFAKMNKINNS